MAEGGRKAGNMGTFRATASVDARILAIAERQQAVLGLDQLREVGLTSGAVRKRAGDKRLHRIHRAVYALVPKSLLTQKGRYMAAVLACGAGAVLSHRSAGALLGLRRSGWWKIEVTVPTRSGRRAPAGVILHRSVVLAACDAIVVDGIPCTSVARTLFDLSEVVDRRQAERAFDQAEILERYDQRAIDDQLARNPTRRGAGVVKAILAEHYIGTTVTESELEEAMLRLSRAVDLPAPEVGKWLDLGDGGPMIRPDFLWRAQRLIVEVDGWRFHRTRQSFESDRRRDQRAMVAGWRVVRTTSKQIKLRPAELRATVAALLAQAPPGGAGSPGAGGVPAPRPLSTPPAGGSTSGRRSGSR